MKLREMEDGTFVPKEPALRARRGVSLLLEEILVVFFFRFYCWLSRGFYVFSMCFLRFCRCLLWGSIGFLGFSWVFYMCFIGLVFAFKLMIVWVLSFLALSTRQGKGKVGMLKGGQW